MEYLRYSALDSAQFASISYKMRRLAKFKSRERDICISYAIHIQKIMSLFLPHVCCTTSTANYIMESDFSFYNGRNTTFRVMSVNFSYTKKGELIRTLRRSLTVIARNKFL